MSRNRTLYIDADACPVTREALVCARRARVPVVIVGNTTQNLERHIRRDDPRDAGHARGCDAAHGGFWVDGGQVGGGAVAVAIPRHVLRRGGGPVRGGVGDGRA